MKHPAYFVLVPPPERIASVAVPFEEDESAGNIWYLDHNFMESMFAMFKKVNGTPASIYGYIGNASTAHGFSP